jgi:hypothetical protein
VQRERYHVDARETTAEVQNTLVGEQDWESGERSLLPWLSIAIPSDRVDAYTQTLTRRSEASKRVSGCARPPHSQMSPTAELLAEAEAVRAENPKRGEEIYKQILNASKSAVNPDELRDQETALVKLGELYRDQKYVHSALPGLFTF